MKKYYDVAGNEIKEGDICRCFHFIGARNKRYYMYKQIGKPFFNSSNEYLGVKVYHLPFDKNSSYIKKVFDIN